LSMNFRVVDEHGRQVAMGRNLAQLRAELGEAAGERFAELAQGQAASERMTAWEFGDLEEVAEIRRGSQTLIGYSALVDHGDAVSLEVFDSAGKGREAHRAGLRRLFMLQLKEQARYVEKNLPGFHAMAMQFTALGEADELRAQLLSAAFDRACMHDPLPRTRAEFERRRDEARSRVTLLAQEIARLVGTILSEHAALQKKLQPISKAFPGACREVQDAAARLLSKGFIERTPYDRLQHFPRYLKAMSLRLDKLRANPQRDTRLAAELAPLVAQWEREQLRQARSGETDPRLEQFRWMLEELRVQLFAQELKTPVPVSVKRLTKIWQTTAGGKTDGKRRRRAVEGDREPAASENALAHGVADARRPGDLGGHRRAVLEPGHHLGRPRAAPVVGLSLDAHRLAPFGSRDLAGLVAAALPVRAGGADDGGADHQRGLDAGEGGLCRRARLSAPRAQEGRHLRGQRVERARRARAVHAAVRGYAPAVADPDPVARAAHRAVRLLQPACVSLRRSGRARHCGGDHGPYQVEPRRAF